MSKLGASRSMDIIDALASEKKARRAGIHQEHAGVCYVAAAGVFADDVIAGGVVVSWTLKGYNTFILRGAKA